MFRANAKSDARLVSHFMWKGKQKQLGKRRLRVLMELRTCRLALVSLWILVRLILRPKMITEMCVSVTAQNWARLPQRQKMREIWRTKREAGVRGVAACDLCKCGYEQTCAATYLEIHTHTHTEQTDTKPHTHKFHFCLVWQHYWNTSALRGRFTYRSWHSHTCVVCTSFYHKKCPCIHELHPCTLHLLSLFNKINR